MPLFRAILQEAVAFHHGESTNFFNDTFQAVFPGAPQAVNAALQAQRSLLSTRWDLPFARAWPCSPAPPGD